jgi:hypothetical protein
LQIKQKNVSCHTADSKPDKQVVNGTVILPPLVFPGLTDSSLNWDFAESIFPAGFAGQGVHGKDPMVWLGGARTPPP